MSLKTYTMLTKPGIIMGNVVTTAAGFALASRGNFDLFLFVMTLLGLGLVIASAGVFNSYTDRVADGKMSRTKDRPLVKGTISVPNALAFGAVLGLVGFSILFAYTNVLTAFVAFFGLFSYLVLYAIWKYRSFYGTLVGSIAGAVPPIVGYCAVSDRLDLPALILFMILVLWQMPHFFAIAIYRMRDYAAASIPVLPVQRGIYATKVQMALYIVAFIATSLLLPFFGFVGEWYAIVTSLLGLVWLALSLYGFKQHRDLVWARQMFAVSLVVIMGMCITIVFDTVSLFSI